MLVIKCACAGEVGGWSESMCDSYVQLNTMIDFSVLSCSNYHVLVIKCACAGEVGRWSESMCDSYVQLYTMTDFSVLSCNNYHVSVSH